MGINVEQKESPPELGVLKSDMMNEIRDTTDSPQMES
jgi:hypothetical protein